MNIGVYRKFLNELMQDALENTDGSTAEISRYLWDRKISGILIRHRKEKERALEDARKAFDEHRHWPIPIVISHLGLNPDDFKVSM
ncbi:MAG TPA: hypothetical protein VIK64_07590 [Anaerolineales bacterium]|jgi:hypothetical protein